MRCQCTIVDNPNIHVVPSTDDDVHLYDPKLQDRYDELVYRYDQDKEFHSCYRKLVMLLHPFEMIRTNVRSNFISGSPELHITNAFMKMWEFMIFITRINRYLVPSKTLRMYDIAGAPGMFIIATEVYLRKHFPQTKLDWYTCSLEGGTALEDEYSLFRDNPSRYQSCNVLVESDLRECMKGKKGKFDLVTGDIGTANVQYGPGLVDHEFKMGLQWGQTALALNLVAPGGIIILKTYKYVTYESIYMLDIIKSFFDKVIVCKPYTSRIANSESYIIGIRKNSKDCSDVPLMRPFIKTPYESPNVAMMREFEYRRCDIRYKAIDMIMNIIRQKSVEVTIKEARNDPEYMKYYLHFKPLFIELCRIGDVNGSSSSDSDSDDKPTATHSSSRIIYDDDDDSSSSDSD